MDTKRLVILYAPLKYYFNLKFYINLSLIEAESENINTNIWIDILTKKSVSHLNEVFHVFNQLTSVDIETAVRKKLTGSLAVIFLGRFFYSLFT